MLPKDLLVDLETGDRTKDHLEAKEQPRNPFSWAVTGTLFSGLQNQQLQNIFASQQAVQGLSPNILLGGFPKW